MHPGKRAVWDSGAWRPDSRVSLGAAAAATLLVMAGFAILFSTAPSLRLSRDTDQLREQLTFSAPVSTLPFPRMRVPTPAPLAHVRLLQSVWPPLPTVVSAPGGHTPQGYLREYLVEREQEIAAALRAKVTGKGSAPGLPKPPPAQALPDDQSYRNVDGQKIARTDDGCAQIQTVQGSPSPTNHVDLAEPTACPGGSPDASEEMGKGLDDWAKKVQRSRPPPR